MGIRIGLVSTKGGSGKSTLTILLAGEFVHAGLKVSVLDTDPQQSVVLWHRACVAKGLALDNLVVASANDPAQLPSQIDADNSDVMLIDVQGSGNAALAMAAANCDLIVIPCIASELDVAQVRRLPDYLQGVTSRRGLGVRYLVVLNGVDGIEMRTRPFIEAIISLKQGNIKLAETIVTKRSFYRHITNGRGSLYMIEDKNEGLMKAISNIHKLVEELVSVLVSPDDGQAKSGFQSVIEVAGSDLRSDESLDAGS